MNRHLIQDSPSMNYILPAAYSLNIHVGDLLLSEIITFSSLLAWSSSWRYCPAGVNVLDAARQSQSKEYRT